MASPPSILILGRRLPGNAASFRRMVRATDLQPGERVLLVGAGDGESLKVLARDFGAVVTALEWEPALVAALENRVREESLGGKVTVRQGDLAHAGKSSFEVVIFDSWTPGSDLIAFATTLRDLLVPNGRMAFTLPAQVGVSVAAPVQEFWSRELGHPFTRPSILLSLVERAGFEPLWTETLSEEVLSDYYRALSEKLGEVETSHADWVARQKTAIDLFQNQGGRQSMSFAMLSARRKEPGEKPPPARTQG